MMILVILMFKITINKIIVMITITTMITKIIIIVGAYERE